jgi:hypothetical protein
MDSPLNRPLALRKGKMVRKSVIIKRDKRAYIELVLLSRSVGGEVSANQAPL